MSTINNRETIRSVRVSGWTLEQSTVHRLRKRFVFGSHVETVQFVNRVDRVCREDGCHPHISVSDTTVIVDLLTRLDAGFSEDELAFTVKIDALSAPQGAEPSAELVAQCCGNRSDEGWA